LFDEILFDMKHRAANSEKHERSYSPSKVNRCMSSPTVRAAVEGLFDSLAEEPTKFHCTKCGSNLSHVEVTFFSPGPSGKIWTVLLPVCPKCDLKEDTAKFVLPVAC
jgi:hypothetical protein